ncbi:MAG: hypothetical protein QOH90_851 [Actinomycetota bacterium]|nr:hypothetical protein [Actinomycetota bacterium]
MTIRPMSRMAAALLLILPLTASCGIGRADDTAATERVEQAEREAARAVAAVSSLRARVGELEAALGGADDAAAGVTRKLDDISGRLWASLKKVRAEIRTARSSASDEAASALAEAQQVARDLSVLKERFDYHLVHDHGGGA